MEKDKLVKKKNRKIYITYTMLFCVISFAVFFVFIKNNKGFIWKSDGFSQHFVILYDFNQIIRSMFENGFSMLSWDMGLGLDMIGQYSYYVIGDPFAYISLLFPLKYLETIYSALIILRMYCVGIAFITYCKYHKKENINTLIGAIIYTFCGFILYAGIRHPYFTNAAILLPLNFIGIDKLLRENKKSFLIFIVFISAVSNYYFFYMITIINVLYAIVKYIFEYNQGIKDFLKKALTAVECYIIGILMAGVILLPTIYDFLNSARVNYEQLYVYSPNFYKNFLIGFVCMRSSNWTIFAVSSIILIMIPILFTKLIEKEARTFTTLFIITTIMLLIPFVASAMNGFSFPSNRWVFAYDFILAYIVTICFERNLKYSKKQIAVMALVLFFYCLIGVWIVKSKIKSNLDFYCAVTIAIILLLIIVLNHIKKLSKVMMKAQKYMHILVILLVICNIWGISFALYSRYGKGYSKEFLDNSSVMKQYDTLKGNMNHFKEAIKYIKENDKEFYRIAKCDIPNQNTALIYDYHSIQTYLSIGNGSVYNFSCGLEDNWCTATRCVNGMDRRTKAMTLLATKYYICNKEKIQYLPYGYKLYKEIEDTSIYINENYLSVGNVYDSYILKDDYEKLSPLEKEDTLLTTAVLEQEISEVKKENHIEEKIDEPVKIEYIEESGIIKDNQIHITQKNQSINLRINKLKTNTELYLSIRNLQYDSESTKTNFKITASFNGVEDSEKVEDCLTSAYYVKNPDFLMNLGLVRENAGNEVKITFDNRGTYRFDSIEILAVPMDSYEAKIEKLKKNEMTNIIYGNDFISGYVNSDTNGILQITTSYSDGWKVFVNGEEKDIIKVNEGFIGTFIEAGEHEIRFEYRTPYLNFGITFSIIGFICFVMILDFERKRKIFDN